MYILKGSYKHCRCIYDYDFADLEEFLREIAHNFELQAYSYPIFCFLSYMTLTVWIQLISNRNKVLSHLFDILSQAYLLCDFLSCDILSCDVLSCNVLSCDVMSMRYFVRAVIS